LIMVTKKGRIKKTPLAAFALAHKRKQGLRGIGISDGDEVKWVRLCQGNSDSIVLATKVLFFKHLYIFIFFSNVHMYIKVDSTNQSTIIFG
jgi:DNA gyrase/topoisomerase IV subunit A